MSKTIREIIALADEARPNGFTNERKTQWLSALEGRLQLEVFLMAEPELLTYAWPADKETQVLVGPPYDELYELYLAARIDFANGESDRYQNSKAAFDQLMGAFSRYFARRYAPAEGHRGERPCLRETDD